MSAPMTDTSLSHLTMSVSPAANLNYRLRKAIIVMLAIPGIRHVFRFIDKINTKLSNIQKSHEEMLLRHQVMQMPEEIPASKKYRAGFGYENGFRELLCGDHYRLQLEQENPETARDESFETYNAVIHHASDTLRKHNVDKVLNFGLHYAHVDNTLAKTFPHVEFTGVGRSGLAKYYNEQFHHQANLNFESSNILDVLDGRPWKNALFMHVRTLSVLPPAFANILYQHLAQSGCEHIVLAEQVGVSWQTGKPYEFSYEPKPSVAFRNNMYIHNYPGLLKEAGYRISYSNLLKTKHPDPNFNILIIVASKAQS